MPDPQVLVVGAGPTGLVLALWLARLGARVRVVDKAEGPGTTSRALGVQARTLELYRQLGLAEAVVARGLEFAAANLWVRGRKVARAAFGEMGKGISPYPYMLIFRRTSTSACWPSASRPRAWWSSAEPSSSAARRAHTACGRASGGRRGPRRPARGSTSPAATAPARPYAKRSASACPAGPTPIASTSPRRWAAHRS